MDTCVARGNETEEANATDDETPKEMGFNCLEILPEEMWSEILEKLGRDYKTLLNCRGISPELKFVAEEELVKHAESFFTEKNYYYQAFLFHWEDCRSPDQRLFVKITRGTHITKLEDVEKFIASKDVITFGNPFPNGCVLFYPGEDVTNHLAFYKSLETLGNTFSHDISTLVYQPLWILDTADLLKHLSIIFKLKNLKRLCIYYSHDHHIPQKFELGTLNKLLQDGFTTIPDITNRLQNLRLREYPPNNGKLPLITVLKNFLPEWKHLEYLSFNWSCSIDMKEIIEQMKEHPLPRKLKTLELQDPSLKLLEYFCLDSVEDKNGIRYPKPCPRYKDIYIHFNKGANTFTSQLQGYSKEESRVIQLFNTLDVNQTDLKLLILDLYIHTDFQPSPGPLPLNYAVQFTKLTELQFNYITLLRWGSLLQALNDKLPNLEKIILECTYECMNLLNESNVKIVGAYHLVCNLWNVFPTVKSIEVLFYEWELKRGGATPENVLQAAKLL